MSSAPKPLATPQSSPLDAQPGRSPTTRPAIHPGLSALSPYPFPRLRALLGDTAPGEPEIDLSLGEPKHPIPPLAVETMAAHAGGWNRYPPPRGTPELRAASTRWLNRRFGLPERLIDPERHLLPLSGTKEGLFACGLVLGGAGDGARTAAAMPDPFYPVYEGAARFGGLEPVFVPPTDLQSGIFDPDGLDPALLARLAVLFVCNPANPQGGVLDRAGLERLVALARTHGFVLVVDECYAEIYRGEPPPSVLEMCGGSLDNLLVYHSLSKRSNAAGLRGGFVAGDPDVIDAMATLRNFAAAGMPLPVQAAAAALWDDDAHAVENRASYAAKFELVRDILGGSLTLHLPEAGFFVWLSLAGTRFADGQEAALALWREAGLKVLPGAYLAHGRAGEPNPGAGYIRLAIVQEQPIIGEAMRRLARVLAS